MQYLNICNPLYQVYTSASLNMELLHMRTAHILIDLSKKSVFMSTAPQLKTMQLLPPLPSSPPKPPAPDTVSVRRLSGDLFPESTSLAVSKSSPAKAAAATPATVCVIPSTKPLKSATNNTIASSRLKPKAKQRGGIIASKPAARLDSGISSTTLASSRPKPKANQPDGIFASEPAAGRDSGISTPRISSTIIASSRPKPKANQRDGIVASEPAASRECDISSFGSLTDPYTIFAPSPAKPTATKNVLKPWTKTHSIKSPEICALMLRHFSMFSLHKCMAPSCSFASSNDDLALAHRRSHDQAAAGTAAVAAGVISCVATWLECAYCDLVAGSAEHLIQHTVDEHRASIFLCPHCFYRSCAAYNVLLHQKSVHGATATVLVAPGRPKDLAAELLYISAKRAQHVPPLPCVAGELLAAPSIRMCYCLTCLSPVCVMFRRVPKSFLHAGRVREPPVQ